MFAMPFTIQGFPFPAGHGGGRFYLRTLESMEQVEAAEWDGCTGLDYPFVRHGFLQALEKSGLVTRERGLTPCHLTLRDEEGSLVAVAPGVVKENALAEYGPEHGCIAAAEQRGWCYYPKWQLEIPLTPVVGPRILVHPRWPKEAVQHMVLAMMVHVIGTQNTITSFHIAKCDARLAQVGRKAGMVVSQEVYSAWHNPGYASMEPFLANGAVLPRNVLFCLKLPCTG